MNEWKPDTYFAVILKPFGDRLGDGSSFTIGKSIRFQFSENYIRAVGGGVNVSYAREHIGYFEAGVYTTE